MCLKIVECGTKEIQPPHWSYLKLFKNRRREGIILIPVLSRSEHTDVFPVCKQGEKMLLFTSGAVCGVTMNSGAGWAWSLSHGSRLSCLASWGGGRGQGCVLHTLFSFVS